MRVIAGEYKGRSLLTVSDRTVRPVTERVKGTIFNMLQNRLALHGSRVLDLFAGSGSLGFEALSRGAGRVLFVDSNRLALDMVSKNVKTLNCSDRCDVFLTDALKFIDHCDEQFDLIFADPPYAFELTHQIPESVFRHELLKRGGFLIIEHSKHTGFADAESFQLSIQKAFGNTRVSFFNYRTKDT